MKKVILLLFMIACLVGCKKNTFENKSDYKINETAIYNDVEYTVTNYYIIDNQLTVNYSIKNTNRREVDCNIFSLLYENENEISESEIIVDDNNRDLIDKHTIKPNVTYSMTETFIVNDPYADFKYLMVISDEDNIKMSVELK